ncbi:hypothetical protein V8C37DRAFT_414697 [Trichoderma ceciliae]
MCLATLKFRLIFIDRSRSLVLPLSMSVENDSYMEDLVGQQPQGKLKPIQAKLTGCTIFRNEIMRHRNWGVEPIDDHYKETKDIDHTLKQAARSLPADRWAFPRTQDSRSNAELKDMATKIVHQLHHFNVVPLLHMPYVIPRLDNCLADKAAQDYLNSKISAMTTARELLTRSIIPVSPNRVSSSTRWNILKIILSTLGPLLAHLDSNRLGGENVLDHQRPGDLLMAERAIQGLGVEATTADKCQL